MIDMIDVEWIGGGAGIGGLVGAVAGGKVGAVAGVIGGAVLGYLAKQAFAGVEQFIKDPLASLGGGVEAIAGVSPSGPPQPVEFPSGAETTYQDLWGQFWKDPLGEMSWELQQSF